MTVSTTYYDSLLTLELSSYVLEIPNGGCITLRQILIGVHLSVKSTASWLVDFGASWLVDFGKQ